MRSVTPLTYVGGRPHTGYMTTTNFTTAFPGTHVTSWTDDEGFDLVTIGIPGVEASTLWVGEYENVLVVWDMMTGHCAPRVHDRLFIALDAHMARVHFKIEEN